MAIAEIQPANDTSHLLLDLRHRRRESAIHQFVQSAVAQRAVRHADFLEASLLRRERLGTTALGRGFAVTGAWSLCVLIPLVVVGLSEKGLEWDAADECVVHLAAIVLTPGEQPHELHARRMEAVVSALHLQRTRQRLLEKRDALQLVSLLREVPR